MKTLLAASHLARLADVAGNHANTYDALHALAAVGWAPMERICGLDAFNLSPAADAADIAFASV